MNSCTKPGVTTQKPGLIARIHTSSFTHAGTALAAFYGLDTAHASLVSPSIKDSVVGQILPHDGSVLSRISKEQRSLLVEWSNPGYALLPSTCPYTCLLEILFHKHNPTRYLSATQVL
jgi:hypothetical protein